MKKDIADQWVTALRSGDYKQGKHALRNADNKFCCLGVLCNLHAQAHPDIAARQKNPEKYLGAYSTLPYEVAKWAGVQTRRGDFLKPITIGSSTYNHLAYANDSGESFDDIADCIEKNYERL